MTAKPRKLTTPEPRIWSSVIRGLELPVIEQNLDFNAILSECGISRQDITKTQNTVPLRKYLEFLESAALKAEDPLLGIRLARAAGPETLGAIGFLFLSSRTLIEALSSLCTYINLLQDATHIQLTQNTTDIVLSYQLTQAGDLNCRQDVEFSLSLVCRLIRMFAGSTVQIGSVNFRHSAAVQKTEYQRLLKAPTYFDQDNNCIVLASTLGRTKGLVLDHSLSRILQEMLDDQLDRQNKIVTLSEQIDEVIYSESVSAPITAKKVAGYFNVSVATLSRRLKSEGTSLSEIVDLQHFETAKDYLSRSAIDITHIAQLIGFAETASFTRAFKRWSGGRTPSQFRNEARIRKEKRRRRRKKSLTNKN